MFKRILGARASTAQLTVCLLIMSGSLFAENYRVDTEGAHASINFKIKHLGYSWLTGRFNDFKGAFSYDAKHPNKSKASLVVKTKSVDSNHAERDIHLRGKKFLNVKKYPQAKFVSTSFKQSSNKSALLTGDLTLHGVTRSVTMKVKPVGAGKDPWGGFRRGFETQLTIRLHDYGIKHNLGPVSEELVLDIYIEGVKDNKYLFEQD